MGSSFLSGCPARRTTRSPTGAQGINTGIQDLAPNSKMALALMRDLFGLDTVTAFKVARVPVRCINSAGGYQFFTPTAVETNRKYADFGAVTLECVAHYASCGRTISNVCGSVGSVASIDALSASLPWPAANNRSARVLHASLQRPFSPDHKSVATSSFGAPPMSRMRAQKSPAAFGQTSTSAAPSWSIRASSWRFVVESEGF